MAADLLRLAIVDDHYLVRDGFVHRMDQWPQGKVVVVAEDGLDYERKCAEMGHIHIAVIDLQMPFRDGFDTLRWMRRDQPRTLPIVITFDPKPMAARLAVDLGARGVLDKGGAGKELVQAMHNVYTHGFHYNEIVSKAMHREWEREGEARHPQAIVENMPQRVREFFLAYARPPFPALKELETSMGLKESGVESLRKEVVRRTGCHRREELIEFLRQAEIQGRVKP